jgi:hypothetical protein
MMSCTRWHLLAGHTQEVQLSLPDYGWEAQVGFRSSCNNMDALAPPTWRHVCLHQ